MAYDALNILQTLVTKTASFSGASFDLLTQTPRRGMHARFIISSYISAATAGSVWTPTVEGSTDGTTFWEIAGHSPLTAGTAALSKEAFISFSTQLRYVRAVMTLSSSAGAPSVTYLVDLGISKP